MHVHNTLFCPKYVKYYFQWNLHVRKFQPILYLPRKPIKNTYIISFLLTYRIKMDQNVNDFIIRLRAYFWSHSLILNVSKLTITCQTIMFGCTIFPNLVFNSLTFDTLAQKRSVYWYPVIHFVYNLEKNPYTECWESN